MKFKIKWNSYFASGILFLVISLFFGVFSLDYPIDHASNMGPGYFPLLFSIILFCLAILTMIVGQFVDDEYNYIPVDWSSMLLVLLAVASFAVSIEKAGMLTTAVILVAFVGHIQNEHTTRSKIVLGIALGVTSYTLLSWGLGMNLYLLPKAWNLL